MVAHTEQHAIGFGQIVACHLDATLAIGGAKPLAGENDVLDLIKDRRQDARQKAGPQHERPGLLWGVGVNIGH